MNILIFLTHSYLPHSSPRAIQIGRLVKNLKRPVTVYASTEYEGVRYVPETKLEVLAGRILGRFAPDVLNRPDKFQWWASRAAKQLVAEEDLGTEDILVTFSQPHSDHIAGLELKRKRGVKWAAFFSDPFTDNPFYKYGNLGFNKILEEEIVSEADLLLFTSQETIDLVMAKYPDALRAKCRVLEHSYSEQHQNIQVKKKNDKIVVRHLGNLYGERSPLTLLKVLKELKPEGVTFDFVGKLQMRDDVENILQDLPPELVTFKDPVAYEESLQLMHEADILLLIEAPFENSPFLPSKLVEYIGAGKPILALTPEGTGARVAREAGAVVADIRDERAIKEAVDRLKDAKVPEAAVQKRFAPQAIARQLEMFLDEL